MAAAAELAWLAARVPAFGPVALPGSGSLALTVGQGITVDDLRGVSLDDDPPVVGEPSPAYAAPYSDLYLPDTAPYVAQGLRPFELQHFTNEWSIQGYGSSDLMDYARGRGFSVLAPYERTPTAATHMPEGTGWLQWFFPYDWPAWLLAQGGGTDRYEALATANVAATLDAVPSMALPAGYTRLMLDSEWEPHDPATLRLQAWYPSGGTPEEKAAFEAAYYLGYARSYTEPFAAARRAGWTSISSYGWAPYPRTYWGLNTATVDPATDWAWLAYGSAIYAALDIVNPSVYCFYPRQVANPDGAAVGAPSVAYVLANLDLNMEMVNAQATKKPVRPYTWHLYHNSNSGWFGSHPQPVDDIRAATAMAFTTGIDGIVPWAWTGTSDETLPPALAPNTWVQVREAFTATLEGGGAVEIPEDANLYIVSALADTTARFQIGDDTTVEPYGTGVGFPYYTCQRMTLSAHLRAPLEPVKGIFEGLALVKAFEYLLRFGTPQIDVTAQSQFLTVAPVVRRVVCEGFHVIMSYDPAWKAYLLAPRSVVITVGGVSVTVPAGRQVQVFVVEE